MSSSNDKPTSISGSCQCGAIRYSITFDDKFSWPPEQHTKSSSCQCTMCRKAIGTLLPQFIHVPVSRIQPPLESSPKFKKYVSSPGHGRGFCSECGGSLTFQSDASDVYALTIGTLDEECLKKYGRILGTPSTEQIWMRNAIPGVTDLLEGGKKLDED
ncbi:hypothetical protein HJFPF1_10106 [Paramyrothecium foliicola]|nr:hypothetical protein HJFPF1_10106 [Paramyrothecium foliicola]